MPDVVVVEGPDAAGYLQGQVSQDLRPIAVGEAAWTFVLEPTGRVVALALVERVATERFDLSVDIGHGDALRDRLARFKLRVNVDITLHDDAQRPAGDHRWVSDDRAVRVARAWPTMGREIEPGHTIPAETGIVDRAVSFTKGCYTGQELVERMDARQATAPRRLVSVTADRALVEGDELTSGGVAVGRVTTSAGHHALAFVNRSVPDGAVLDGGVALAPHDG